MCSRALLATVLLLALAGCGSSRPTAGMPVTDPLQVLHDWDAARSLAWEQADPVVLAGLYLPGSRAGVQDVALLRRYLARGVRVTGMRMQVLSARTVVRSEGRLRLVVVERFAGAHVGTPGARVPAGEPVSRVIELRRPGDRWLLASVRPWPPAGSR